MDSDEPEQILARLEALIEETEAKSEKEAIPMSPKCLRAVGKDPIARSHREAIRRGAKNTNE